MSDRLFIVNLESNQLAPVSPVAISELGVKERADLQEWVLSNLQVLGEELFLVTSEFHGFDKSDRRFDILALDKRARLVVIELKLDAKRTFADQQAIRYAAFCSTMTMDQVVEQTLIYHGETSVDARYRICEFLEVDSLPELTGQPRVILAAFAMEDQELTSTVLWLRNFGVDISCVELAPYRLPGDGTTVLAPRVLIPLKEAIEYTVRVEQKQASLAEREKDRDTQIRMMQAIADHFNAEPKPDFPYEAVFRATQGFLQIPVGHKGIHYEWNFEGKSQVIRIALHLESRDTNLNEARLQRIAEHKAKIESDLGLALELAKWGYRGVWRTAEFRLPYSENARYEPIARRAALLMSQLVDRTWPIVQRLVSCDGGQGPKTDPTAG